jgi:hypothetical protein
VASVFKSANYLGVPVDLTDSAAVKDALDTATYRRV